jgi:drug/metabolite transporter (DMT)-like permease
MPFSLAFLIALIALCGTLLVRWERSVPSISKKIAFISFFSIIFSVFISYFLYIDNTTSAEVVTIQCQQDTSDAD